MPRRLRACFVLTTVLASLPGCSQRVSPQQDDRPLPTPEPPASPSARPRTDPPSPATKRPPEEPGPYLDKPADKPRAVAIKPVAPTLSVSTGTVAAPQPSVVAAGGAPALPTIPLLVPSAACLSRCQAAMQGCLSAPVDGGVPGFGNLELCKGALNACQSACTKP